MKKHFYYKSKDGITRIHGIRWIPEGEVKAVLQIAHGMCEFIERYDEFAQFLNTKGILVVGNDILGHGKSVREEMYLGYFKEIGGNDCVLRDFYQLTKATKKDYPEVPYFFLGHSMGSFLAVQYAQRYGSEINGLILSGAGRQQWYETLAAKAFCHARKVMKGSFHRSRVLNSLSIGSFSKGVENPRTPQDWLTKDEKIVDAYRANPLNMFTFTLNGFYNLMKSVEGAQNRDLLNRIPKRLPILLAAGSEDPVGAKGKKVIQWKKEFALVGMDDVELKLYQGDRHEILNETDRDVVYEDMLDWMEKRYV